MKMLSQGLMVSGLLLSTQAMATEFNINCKKSFSYNCGGYEWPQSSFCASRYSKCSSGGSDSVETKSARSRRAAERQAPKDESQDETPAPAPAPAPAPEAQPRIPRAALGETEAGKAPPVRVAQRTDVASDAQPVAPMKLGTTPGEQPPADQTVRPIPTSNPTTPPAAPADAADAPKPEVAKVKTEAEIFADGKEVCTKNPKEIMYPETIDDANRSAKMKVLQKRINELMGGKQKFDSNIRTINLNHYINRRTVQDCDAVVTGWFPPAATFKGCELQSKMPDATVIQIRENAMISKKESQGYKEDFSIEMCAGPKGLKMISRAATANSLISKAVGGSVTTLFTKKGNSYHFDAKTGDGAIMTRGDVPVHNRSSAGDDRAPEAMK